MMDVVKDWILSTPTFPYLWLPHCLLMCLALRAALGEDYWKSFSRRHPLSCFLLSMLYIYPGGILSSFLLGKPILTFLTLSAPFYGSVVSWYLAFYCPRDLFFRAIRSSRLLPLFSAAQDWQRIGLVLAGLQTINAEHDGYLIYPVVFATVKSSGFMIVKYIENAIMKGWSGAFFIPNQASKTMVISGFLLQMQLLYRLFPVSDTDLYCYLVIYALVLRLCTTLFSQDCWDPYDRVEQQLCSLLYGIDDAEDKDKPDKKDDKKTN